MDPLSSQSAERQGVVIDGTKMATKFDKKPPCVWIDMFMRRASSTLVFLALAVGGSAQASIVFQDNFTDDNGTALADHTPTVGTGWDVEDGAPEITSNAVSTYYSGSDNTTQAFGAFTSALGAGQVLDVTFSFLDPSPGTFNNEGWGGISLFTGGSGGTEHIFLGNVSGSDPWGISGSDFPSHQTFDPNITAAVQSVHFTYTFDTGAWFYQVGSGTLSGTIASGYGFDTVRIGAGAANDEWTSITVDDLSIATVPEPSTYALLGLSLGLLGLARRSPRKHVRRDLAVS